MSKHIEMLRCFRKVMLNNKEEIEKVIPDMYCKNFYDIDILFLVSNGIKKLIIDIDGTILPADSIDVGSMLEEKILRIKDRKDIRESRHLSRKSKRLSWNTRYRYGSNQVYL